MTAATFLSYLNIAGAEITLALSILFISVVDMFFGDRFKNFAYRASMFALVVVFAWLCLFGDSNSGFAFQDMFVSDHLSVILKQTMCVMSLLAMFYSRDYLKSRQLFKSEYYLLILYATLGIMIMISGHNLLSLYLGLELMSLSVYGLVAFNRDSPIAAEAAMKYFVLGAIASGTLLYGMSMLYGMTGSLDIATIATSVQQQGISSLPILFSLAFLIVGVAFKLGAVPFHMWIPDVYEGAPSPVTLFIGTAPKLAAYALTYRLLVDAMGDLHGQWTLILSILAVLSMLIGNLVAIVQNNVRRLLAYSTISHVGFILLGFIAGTQLGYEAALFYTVTYVVMAAGAFGIVVLLSRDQDTDQLAAFKGLNQRSPWLAFLMLCLMFGMAGVPPFVGFHAKLAVISAVLDAGHLWLGILAVLFSVIGAYYYLRVVWFMYFDEPETSLPLNIAWDHKATLSLNSISVLALGILPGAIWALVSLA
ncbi:MAG: NADH-quinone oxidoreductase subunit NuoN [Gammaproteobacteria bacterium]|nr:NADH-quinone oxidoreductase subunit NuoN [Gammaproteobacteria bacterium]NNC97030.1 NADH-quinone oxidoreductase subunit NuoN [Gammaproteobacteria bacterium]NNM13864.1 NADH-quinone oxidoreductase subunit NuoN [Gammaproteobacteria bacterium]